MKRNHLLIALAVFAVGGYLLLRWYENKQSAQSGNTQGGAGLGSNLNSVAPELVGGSTGPSIGPALSAPVTINVTGGSPSGPSQMANPAPFVPGQPEESRLTPMQSSYGKSTNALMRANPENSGTGAQAAAPQYDNGEGQMAAASAGGAGITAATPVNTSAAQPNTRTATTVDVRRGPVVHHRHPRRPLRRPGSPKGR